MYLHPLALASILRTVLFTALSLDNFSNYFTIAAADVSLRSAHLITYVGLSRSGLQLPVSTFFPPPRSVTPTDVALYITPVAAASWRPAVEAFNTLLVAVPRIVVIDSETISRTRHTLSRTYARYTRLLVDTQPRWSLANRQPDSIRNSWGNWTYDHDYAHGHFPRFLSARTHRPTQPLSHSNWSLAPSPAIDPKALYDLGFSVHESHIQSSSRLLPSEPSSVGYRAPISAAISLGQCTPHRVLPAQVEIILAYDVLDEPKPKPEIDICTRILDQPEPEVASKEFVVYTFPPCTKGSCELTVFIEPAELVVGKELPVYSVFLRSCHVWFACRSIWRIFYILFTILVFLYPLAVDQFKLLATVMVDVCGRFSPHNLTRTDDPVPETGVPSPIDSFPLSTESTDLTPVPDCAPDLTPAPVASPDLDTVAQDSPSEPVHHKKRSPKKVGFDPASIPLPKDDKPWEAEPASEAAASPLIPAAEPEPEPAAPHSIPATTLGLVDDEPTPSPTVDAPAVPPPDEDKGASVGTSSDQPASSSPIAGISNVGCVEDDEGEWTTVVKRKPWRPRVPVPGEGTSSSLEGRGKKGEKAPKGGRRGNRGKEQRSAGGVEKE
ncbi:hypothetical protein RhiJN_09810 [Ceratobasidium sp. AG-Ba]|nr:hypothetical protein RhiJN_09810 [Ceratobasidium sp. AG-Ba]QRW10562.1 hypothetical protein RhiLY_09561 [Ceratobasidium sp. AG-Ba]